MKLANFLRYVLLPVLVLAAGVKVGVEYAKSVYVSKDRKFIKGEVVESNEKQ